MPNNDRRSAARRRAWGRGPVILRFEPLEGRTLLATTAVALPDLTAVQIDTSPQMDWGEAIKVRGAILNQGDAPAGVPFHVNIYASTTPQLETGSFLLGQATIPAGLRPGERAPFEQEIRLPATAPVGLPTSGQVYIGLVVDPDGYVVERNESNNSGNGQGADLTVANLATRLPASLVGVSLGVYPDQLQWGQSLRLTAQIRNDAAGEAPATRARVVLTPAGATPGGDSDVTIGSIQVPPIAPWQTVLVNQSVDLPSLPPVLLAGSSGFLLSLVQDADFVVNPFAPHRAVGGPGIDMAPVLISTPGNQQVNPNAPLPDLVTTTVEAPSLPLTFGQTFQVTARVQNQGTLDSGPYRVRFFLVRTDASLEDALFLADTTLNGLKAGYAQDVVQTLRLPGRLPLGTMLGPNAQGRIAVVIDPENVFDESSKANNLTVSGIVGLQLIGTDGQVTTPAQPTAPAQPPSGTTRPTPGTGRTPASPQRPSLIPGLRPLRPTGTAPSGLGIPGRASGQAAGRRQVVGRAPRTPNTPPLRIYPVTRPADRRTNP